MIKEINEDAFSIYNSSQYYNYDNYDDYDDYDKSYSKYGGAYGYDDDTIDSAFEGDPENYWNID